MTIRDISVAFGFDIDKASQTQAENSIKGLKSMATKLLGKIAVVFSVAKLASFAKSCVEAASNVEEMENKFNTVFDHLSDEVDQWAEDFANSVGRNKNTIKAYLADQQNLLVGFGMTREEGAKLSEEMTSLALDIASFSNQDEDVAVNAMTKAVMGESEAAKTLGAVLNDTTRAETMQALGMQGTYESLSQLEKMQVNYQAILRQSPDAIGDCVRSMGSYESSTRQLKAAQEEFKEFVGGQLLPVMSVFVQWVTKGTKAATSFAKAILLDAEGNNRILLAFERVHAIIKRLQPAMERFTSSMKNGINKATDTVKSIVNRMGGMENALKLLALIAGAFILAMNWSKIIGGAKAFLSLIGGIGKLFSFANLKILGVIAVIVILALIVEDFINFLLGNESVIGTIFDELGIGADNAREAIFGAFTKVKDFLVKVWDSVKPAWDAIQKALITMWNALLNAGKAVFKALYTAITTVFEWIKSFWNRWGSDVKNVFGRIWDSMGHIAQDFLNVITGIANFISSVFSGDWKGAWEAVKSICANVWDGIKTALSTAWENIKTLSKIAVESLPGLLKSGWEALKSAVSAVGRSLPGLLTAGWAMLKSLALAAVRALPGLLSGAWEALKSAIKAVGSNIGPLLNAGWQMLKNLAKSAVGSLPGFLSAGWSTFKNGISSVGDGLGTLLDKGWDALKSAASSAVDAMPDALSAGWEALKGGISAVGDGFGTLLDAGWDALTNAASNAVDALPDALSAGWDSLKTGISAVGDGLGSLLDEGWSALKEAAGGAVDWIKDKWEGIKDFFSGIWDGITGGSDDSAKSVEGAGEAVSNAGTAMQQAGDEMLSAGETATSAGETFSAAGQTIVFSMDDTATSVSASAKSILQAIKDTWANVLTTTRTAWNGVKTAIANSISSAKTSVSTGISNMKSSFNAMSSIATSAYKWGYDLSSQMARGIREAAPTVKAAADEVASNVRSVLHFSVPDTGPLADADTYMPDFMKLLAGGISRKKGEVLGELKGFAGDMQKLMASATADVSTAATSTINKNSSTVTQNVNIENSYSGGSAETQKNVSKAMNKSAVDATTQMARGLAYARG